MTEQRRFALTSLLEKQIEQQLKQLNYWGKWSELGKAIAELSDHFIAQNEPTPWGTARMQAAYLSYFLPLNFARLSAVFAEAQRLHFPCSEAFIDIGSGPGTAHLAARDRLPFATWKNWESAPAAIELHQKLLGITDVSSHCTWLQKQPSFKSTTAVASYALNEWTEWPKSLFEAEQLIVVEPSTQIAGRRLMEFRQKLIENDFYIWAPCTHQQSCPLLKESKRDWCHDRIYFSPPAWWQDMEQHVPMRNNTLTFSYLLAAKQKPEWLHAAQKNTQAARIIGDTLYEKGKTRQAVCRGPQREFLAWLKRDGEAPTLQHGQWIDLPLVIEKRGNELRLKS